MEITIRTKLLPLQYEMVLFNFFFDFHFLLCE